MIQQTNDNYFLVSYTAYYDTSPMSSGGESIHTGIVCIRTRDKLYTMSDVELSVYALLSRNSWVLQRVVITHIDQVDKNCFDNYINH